jgi:hypothetical protein
VPLSLDAQLVTTLSSLKNKDLKILVSSCNTELHLCGYPSIHQNRVADSKGYYYCGCGDKKCFKVVFDRHDLGKKKGKMWSISSIGERNCEPGTIVEAQLLWGEIIVVLKDLSEKGHFVKLDFKTNGSGKKYLNRFFVSFKSMCRLFNIWGEHVATLDSTYG